MSMHHLEARVDICIKLLDFRAMNFSRPVGGSDLSEALCLNFCFILRDKGIGKSLKRESSEKKS